MAVPTPTQGFWTNGLAINADRINWSILQADTLANRPSADADINGAIFLATDEGVLYQVQSGAWVAVQKAPRSITKAADEIVNNSTTLQNDDELAFTVPANKSFSGYIMLKVSSPTPTTALKFAFTVPTAGAIKGSHRAVGSAGITEIADFTTATNRSINTTSWFIIDVKYDGGANAGTVQFQWAQNAAVAEDTTVEEETFMLVMAE